MSTEVKETTEGSTNEIQAGSTGAEGAQAQGAEAAGSAEAGATEGTASSEEAGDAAAAPAVEGTPAPYKARDKFKVRVFDPQKADDLIQKEEAVPEWLRPLIKDEASEKQVMDLLEKAYGIDAVKGERAHVKQQRDHYRTEFSKVQDSISELRGIYQRGDIDMFLNKLSIPQERMLQWALDKVNYSQLPPDQQRAIDERQEAQRRAYAAEKRVGSYESQVHEQARQAKSMLLDAGLARPDVSTFAEAFDAKVGKPGAFKSEVIAAGALAWSQSNGQVDLSPEQAIEQALTKWKPFLGETKPTAPSAATVGSQAGAGSQPNPSAKPSVIPNVQGKTSSPMKSKPRSIEDLKKLAANFPG